ncbi:MAG: hypothetical protein GC168_00505 [Candidatus Hydrogenedens sp.]|nr:hypothetical protein [Candidatus Hydrogenedens sp.]
MQYVKSSQIVPGKGYAWTYYEVDDKGTVLRQLTHIDGTGEISRVPDPIVKKLMRPELCQPASDVEFARLWDAE